MDEHFKLNNTPENIAYRVCAFTRRKMQLQSDYFCLAGVHILNWISLYKIDFYHRNVALARKSG